jgi:hypothetical protein
MVDAWGVRRTDLEGYDGVPRRTIFILDPEMKVLWRWITSPEQRLPDTLAVLAEAKKIGEAPAKVTRKPAAKKSTRAVKPKKP